MDCQVNEASVDHSSTEVILQLGELFKEYLDDEYFQLWQSLLLKKRILNTNPAVAFKLLQIFQDYPFLVTETIFALINDESTDAILTVLVDLAKSGNLLRLYLQQQDILSLYDLIQLNQQLYRYVYIHPSGELENVTIPQLTNELRHRSMNLATRRIGKILHELTTLEKEDRRYILDKIWKRQYSQSITSEYLTLDMILEEISKFTVES